MKHHDRKTYGREVISKDDLLRDRLIKFLIVLAALIIAVLVNGCSSAIHATSASGEALEAKGDYGYVRLDAVSGKADYNTFLEIYFGYPVQKGEKVVVVPQRYLDSLRASRQ